MTFGEKLRQLRTLRGMTQSGLAGEIVTRNMLSRLENDAAHPSLGTLKLLCERLEVPVGYFLDDLSGYELAKLRELGEIRRLLREGQADACLELCLTLGEEADRMADCEICLIVAECAARAAMALLEQGETGRAKQTAALCMAYAEKSVYGTELYRQAAALCLGIAARFEGAEDAPSGQTAFFWQVCGTAVLWADDAAVGSELLAAAADLREGRYGEAVPALEKLLEGEAALPNRYRLLSMLEDCYSGTGNYERAYLCARQKLELLEKLKP